MCILLQNKVVVEKKRTQSQLQQKGFGERTGHEYVLDLKEALYLLEKKKIKLKDGKGKSVGKKALLQHAEKREKGFYNKFTVFRDLREKGFCVKTGFKFGFDFRVYPRGKKPGQAHTQWVVHVAEQSERLSMPGLSRMVRLSGNIRTLMLVAIVDSENDINYYSVDRITP
ncbi:MAG: tRNA-intron lyase [Candidatus Diapherotrites archaeon]|uniref:tRNA-intron lyase n=1 Tax=Candidatus Iainarchaeum sp. TaxID=3101447 RepID=A0A938YUX1_9ARCH|nr:tRNA-intron lyase [Candidatus Diapherotrites archaeon]